MSENDDDDDVGSWDNVNSVIVLRKTKVHRYTTLERMALVKIGRSLTTVVVWTSWLCMYAYQLGTYNYSL